MMNQEVTHHEKEANIIKFPSMEDILNNVRYLLSAITIAVSVLIMISITKQKNPSIDSIIILLFIFLSGWFSALTSHKTIVQFYKSAKKVSALEVILRSILTGLWITGLSVGIFFLYILLTTVFK